MKRILLLGNIENIIEIQPIIPIMWDKVLFTTKDELGASGEVLGYPINDRKLLREQIGVFRQFEYITIHHNNPGDYFTFYRYARGNVKMWQIETEEFWRFKLYITAGMRYNQPWNTDPKIRFNEFIWKHQKLKGNDISPEERMYDLA